MKNIAKSILNKVVKGLNNMAYSSTFSSPQGSMCEEPKMPKCMLKK